MSFVVVDASVWVSRLIPQDEFHAQVKEWMQRCRQTGTVLLSPGLLLSEVAGAISRRTGEASLAYRAVGELKRVPSLRLVEMDKRLVREAANLAADLGLRGADAFYVAVAAQLKLSLATLDNDQRQRGSYRIEFEKITPVDLH